jgi:hypothetical protein
MAILGQITVKLLQVYPVGHPVVFVVPNMNVPSGRPGGSLALSAVAIKKVATLANRIELLCRRSFTIVRK